MAVEYWLQKKSLGGWSVVTWYSDLDQAKLNYQRCIEKGMSGYSWRLVEVKVVEQALLDEVTDIEPPGLAPELPQRSKPVLAVTPAGVKGWSKTGGHWGDHSGNVVPIQSNGGWADIPSDSSKPEHGLTGSVWMVNHKEKKKCRVPANEVALLEGLGYERGGPKTKFRE